MALFFASVAELEYGNSYEIEYMEKIGSSVPVSSHPICIHLHSPVVMHCPDNAINLTTP